MSLPRRFSITIDGMPVAMPKSDPQERPQAEPARNGERPAVFEIVENHLVCGELVMGRSFIEDRSLMPKRVIWSPVQEMNQIQPIRVEQGEDGPELRLQGMIPVSIAGNILTCFSQMENLRTWTVGFSVPSFLVSQAQCTSIAVWHLTFHRYGQPESYSPTRAFLKSLGYSRHRMK